jgi:hypothetical protein
MVFESARTFRLMLRLNGGWPVGGFAPVHGLWALVFVPEGTVPMAPHMSVVPNAAVSFCEPNQDVIATGSFQTEQPIHYLTRLARNLQAGGHLVCVWLP